MTRTIPTNIRGHQSGFTLVELMVAATLGLFLLGGLVQMVSGLKQTYRVQNSVSRVQETARFAMEFITREARIIDFFGCANPSTMTFTNNVSNMTGVPAFGNGSLEGFDGIASGDIAGSSLNGLVTVGTSNADVIAGTDLFRVLNGGSVEGGEVVAQTLACNANITIANAATAGITQNSVVMVTNCSHVDQFRVTNNATAGGTPSTVAHAASGNTSANLNCDTAYGQGDMILKYNSHILYIGVGQSGQNALFKRTFDDGWGVAQELIDGIEDMQITYGEDTDPSGSSGYGAPNYYVPADNVVNMDRVVAMRISLLIPTLEDNVSPTNQNYNYFVNNVASNITATDNRIYRVYTSTVALRNRLQ